MKKSTKREKKISKLVLPKEKKKEKAEIKEKKIEIIGKKVEELIERVEEEKKKTRPEQEEEVVIKKNLEEIAETAPAIKAPEEIKDKKYEEEKRKYFETKSVYFTGRPQEGGSERKYEVPSNVEEREKELRPGEFSEQERPRETLTKEEMRESYVSERIVEEESEENKRMYKAKRLIK